MDKVNKKCRPKRKAGRPRGSGMESLYGEPMGYGMMGYGVIEKGSQAAKDRAAKATATKLKKRELALAKKIEKAEENILAHELVNVQKARSGSKTAKRGPRKNCNKLKTPFRREVCKHRLDNANMSYKEALEALKKPPRKNCNERGYKNPWIEYLCNYRRDEGYKYANKGFEGQQDLVRAAAAEWATDKYAYRMPVIEI
jgi:hypothetical protein